MTGLTHLVLKKPPESGESVSADSDMGQAICSSESRMMTSHAKCGDGGSCTRSDRTRRPRRRDSRPAHPSISPRRVRERRMPVEEDDDVRLGDSSRTPDRARGLLGRVGDTPGRGAGEEGEGEGDGDGPGDAVVLQRRDGGRRREGRGARLSARGGEGPRSGAAQRTTGMARMGDDDNLRADKCVTKR